RQCQGAVRPAGSQGRTVSRRRRHAARRPHAAARRGAAIFAQGRSDRRGACQGDEARRCGGAAGRADQSRQRLDRQRWQRHRAVGRRRLQAARRPGAFQGRHDGVHARQCDLSARDFMQVVYEGLQLPMDQALRVESRYFAKILRSPQAAAMIRSLFLSLQEINKGARRPASVPKRALKKIGVLGAGFMGAGIAYVSAQAGLDVVLLDRDPEIAAKGKAQAERLINAQVERGRTSTADRDALLARIAPTADYVALKDCDLIIEAVFEDRKVKEEAIGRAQNVIGEPTIFGSNTSTLPISSLAAALKDRARFIGIHFFSPVDRMMLVEIILGRDTGEAALAVALDYVRAIRKTPIVVNDSRGFYTSRVVGTYLREGHLMLSEGVPAAMIENVGRMAGMPVGPLALNDEVAVDLAWKILKATEADLGP